MLKVSGPRYFLNNARSHAETFSKSQQLYIAESAETSRKYQQLYIAEIAEIAESFSKSQQLYIAENAETFFQQIPVEPSILEPSILVR